MTNTEERAETSAVILRGVNDENLAAMVAECMEFMDWRSLVKPGATVVLKPNCCTAIEYKWQMSNTDPRIAEAVCRVLRERTEKIFIVESDGLREQAWPAFDVSGYRKLEKELGATLVNLSESEAVEMELPSCGRVKLPRLMLECDVFITLPVLKTHALTYFTGALKNQWGCVPQYDRILLHRYLHQMLGELHEVFKPVMAIMDGIIAMEGRGPTNGKARRMDLLLASRDSVALDATAMRLVGLDPRRCEHVVYAADRLHLGRWKESEIQVDGDWKRHATQFEPAILDAAIGAMDYMSRYRWFVKYMLEQNYIFYPIRALVQLLRRIGVVEGG